MKKVGITGQSGFIGMHLYNTLRLYPDEFERIPFEDVFFEDQEKLKSFVNRCDAIVHLAAMNRHDDPQVIYDTNMGLVEQLLEACEATESKPHILFASSIQENRDNLYGKSKKDGRKLFEKWAKKNGAQFTGLVIPNVLGPFGKPYYNSVVATFCHQLTHNEKPEIDADGEVKMIYVGELIQTIIRQIMNPHSATAKLEVPYTTAIKVSDLLRKLTSYRDCYFKEGIIPDLNDPFARNLFNTFVCYFDHASFFPFPLKKHSDERGSFVETVKVHSGGQVSFSTTKPGITRGNHFHTRKAERFAVIKGSARIVIRRIGTEKALSFELDGAEPSFVDMPIWCTHNITNIGDEDLFTIFWTNEHFNPKDPDTYNEKV